MLGWFVAFLAGTTRTGASEKLASKGVTAVKFKFGDADSADAAIQTAGADLVWFTTLMNSKRATEAGHGITIVDACKRANVKFVCYSSVADAEKVIAPAPSLPSSLNSPPTNLIFPATLCPSPSFLHSASLPTVSQLPTYLPRCKVRREGMVYGPLLFLLLTLSRFLTHVS